MQSPQLKNKRIVYKILILIHPSLHEYNWYPIKSKMRQNFTKKQIQIQTSDQGCRYFLPGLERGLGCKRKPVQFCNPYILAIKKRTQSASLIILSEFTANTKNFKRFHSIVGSLLCLEINLDLGESSSLEFFKTY